MITCTMCVYIFRLPPTPTPPPPPFPKYARKQNVDNVSGKRQIRVHKVCIYFFVVYYSLTFFFFFLGVLFVFAESVPNYYN